MGDSLGPSIKSSLEEVRCKMPFKSRKSLWVTSDIVWELQTAGAETRKAQELQASFIRGAVSRLADVEPRSLD